MHMSHEQRLRESPLRPEYCFLWTSAVATIRTCHLSAAPRFEASQLSPTTEMSSKGTSGKNIVRDEHSRRTLPQHTMLFMGKVSMKPFLLFSPLFFFSVLPAI